jgi:hypothetical protein
MSTFPTREADIIALAQSVITGMSENPDFPSPPVSTSDLRNQLDVVLGKRDAHLASDAATKQLVVDKRVAIKEMSALLKKDLRYAENTVDGDGIKLSTLGWGGTASPSPLQPPGQPRLLKIREQGEDWLILEWKRPAEGGRVSSYTIERRKQGEGGGAWMLAGTTSKREVTLNDQERGVEWEYRVIASNKAGEGMASNTVEAVL